MRAAWALLALAACRFEAAGETGHDAPLATDGAPRDTPLAGSDASAGDAGHGVVTFGTGSASTARCATNLCQLDVMPGPENNQVVLLWYFCADGSGATTSVNVVGAPLTMVAARSGPQARGELWLEPIVVPSLPLTVNVTSTCASVGLVALSAANVDITDAVRDSNSAASATNTKTEIDLALDSAPGDLVLAAACHGSRITGVTGQSERVRVNVDNNSACANWAAGTEPGMAVVSPAFTSNLEDWWVMLAASLKPAS